MSRLDNNLHALARHQPHIPATFKKLRPLDSAIIEESRQGGLTAKIITDAGDVWLHSRMDPRKEAQRLVAGVDPTRYGTFLVYGFGCGHHIAELLGRVHAKARVIVVEPNDAWLRNLLESADLVSILADPRLILLTHMSSGQIFDVLERHLVAFFLGSKVVTHEPSVRAGGDIYRKASQIIREFLDFGTTSLYTAAAISTQSKFNCFMNLPHSLFNPGVSTLAGLANRKPAIVVGAGPSLQRNIRRLKDCGAVIIATGTILKRLLAEGIEPHYVCSIDYHYKLTKKYMQDLPPLPHTTLVVDPKANHHIADIYPGPVRTWDDPFMATLLRSFRKVPHGTLPPAGTVSQTAFHLAQLLGCDPIIFVGQDLAYPGHITHMPGTAILDDWAEETNRFHTYEDKEWEYFARTRKGMFSVESLEGGTIYTDRQMFTYLKNFGKIFRECPQRVIDASEAGALKEGAEHMSLEKALREAGSLIDASFVSAPGLSRDTSRKVEAMALLAARMGEINDLLEVFEDQLANLGELKEALDDEKRFNQLLRRVDEARKKLDRLADLSGMVNELAQADDYRRQKDDLEIMLGGQQGQELRRLQLERDERFIIGLQGALRFMREFLKEACARVESYPEIPTETVSGLEVIRERLRYESR
ncbi:MAG: motility associated factor glycosyltransferase family protein [Planctomycetota bacterium]